jgi:hypothetical protein
MGNNSKKEMLEILRGLVREALKLRRDGAVYARLARASGAVDGYLRALVDAGVATRSELLDLVTEERVKLDGPATGGVRTELDSIIAA